jgi:hypothetical protein
MLLVASHPQQVVLQHTSDCWDDVAMYVQPWLGVAVTKASLSDRTAVSWVLTHLNDSFSVWFEKVDWHRGAPSCVPLSFFPHTEGRLWCELDPAVRW